MGYVIYECTAEGCSGRSGHTVRDIDVEGFERWHGYFDTNREHTLRKVGEPETPDPVTS